MTTGLPRRVLVTAANYWPEENGNAPYTTGLAEELAANGVEVTVLSAMPHYPQWEIRAPYRGQLRVREVRAGVRLIRSWLWVPRHQSAVQRALFEGSFLLDSLTVTGVDRPDVVLGVIPSLSGGVLARLASRRYRVPYGVIVQDLVGAGAIQSGIRGGASVASSVRRAEAWALRGATSVGIVSQAFELYVRDLGVDASSIAPVRNWAEVAAPSGDREQIRRRLGWDVRTPVALHAGAMGLKQGLAQVAETARLAAERGSRLRFVFAGDGSEREEVEQAVSGAVGVTFLPPQDPVAYADLLCAADVLVISERPAMVNMSLPAKLTSYAAAGRPIVAAVPPEGATADEVERSGAGLVTPAGDPSALLAAIERIVAEPALAEELGSAGRRYAAARLDRGAALAQLRDFVAQLASGAGAPSARRPEDRR